MSTATSSHPKRLRGTVQSNRMARTVSVSVGRTSFHKKLRRYFRRDKNFFADSAVFSPSPGDKVVIEETRPLSRHKRWKVVEVLQAAVQKSTEEVDEDLSQLSKS